MNDLRGRFCKEPFSILHIGYQGKTFLCCPAYQKFNVGNIFTAKDIDSIWNSIPAKVLRKSVCDGSFSYCNDFCGLKVSGNLPWIDEGDEQWQKIISNPMKNLDFLPRRVQLAYDCSCNLRCIFCRHQYYHASESEYRSFEKVKDTLIKPLLKNVEMLEIAGGEVFASKHLQTYFEELTMEEYPKLQYYLITNGTLFNKETWNRYPSLQEKIHTVNVSIDAAKKETYEAIRRGGNWEALISNLHFISQLRKNNKIKVLKISFVVQRSSYKEMAEFIHLGIKFDVDLIVFSRIENTFIHSEEDFIDMDVCDARNEEHNQFLEVFKHPLFRDKRVWLGNILPQVIND